MNTIFWKECREAFDKIGEDSNVSSSVMTAHPVVMGKMQYMGVLM